MTYSMKDIAIQDIKNATTKAQLKDIIKRIGRVEKKAKKEMTDFLQDEMPPDLRRLVRTDRQSRKLFKKEANKYKKEFLEEVDGVRQQAVNKLKTLDT